MLYCIHPFPVLLSRPTLTLLRQVLTTYQLLSQTHANKASPILEPFRHVLTGQTETVAAARFAMRSCEMVATISSHLIGTMWMWNLYKLLVLANLVASVAGKIMEGDGQALGTCHRLAQGIKTSVDMSSRTYSRGPIKADNVSNWPTPLTVLLLEVPLWPKLISRRREYPYPTIVFERHTRKIAKCVWDAEISRIKTKMRKSWSTCNLALSLSTPFILVVHV